MPRMLAAEFFGLERVDDDSWRFDVIPRLATGGSFLFGGCGLGAACAALEISLDRRVVWASAQYLSFAGIGETIELSIDVIAAGHFTSQARVTAKSAGREVFFVIASLGTRPNEFVGQWATCIDVPSPDDCERRTSAWDTSGTIMAELDVRLAYGLQWEELGAQPPKGDGRAALWVRPNSLAVDTPALAVLGDYVPFGISQALSRWTFVNSLDNTLRIVKLVPTEWVLLDIRVHGAYNGFGHGLIHLWAEDGTLLATASQSAVIRPGMAAPTPKK